MASEGNVIYYGFNKKLGKIAREDRWYRRYDNVARPCIEIKNSSEEASTMNGHDCFLIVETFVSTLLDFPFFLSYNKKEERNEKGRARRC